MAETTLLNIDINFTNKPALIGNRYVSMDFVSSSDIRTRLEQYMNVDEIIKKLNLKHKCVGQMTNSTEQVIPFYKRLVDKGVVQPLHFTFVHIGAHSNLYSHEGHFEYENKKEIHNYDPHNAFAYFFVKKFIDKMIWVYPDHYTEDQVDKHFEGMDFYKRSGYHIVSINQGLRFIVKPIQWSKFTTSNYDWKAISIITNPHTANYKPEDLQKLKQLIF